MSHITQEQALLLQDWAEQKAVEQLGSAGEYHPDEWKVEAHLLCNAAIQHYIDSAALAQPEPVEPAKQWVMTAPDGTTFAGDTPLRAANQASKYRLEIDPVAAKKFLDAIETIRKEGEEEHDRCMKEYGTLNCPACGGSGHIGDVTDGDTLAAAKGGAV